MDAKKHQQNINKQNQQHRRRIIHNAEVGFMSGIKNWCNFSKSVNIMYHINKVSKPHDYINKCRNAF